MRLSIRNSNANGAIKYQKTYKPTTSPLVLFPVNVDMGTVLTGSFRLQIEKIADYEANHGSPSDKKREILKQELTERFKSEQSTPSNN